MSRAVDLTGQVFGRLMVVERGASKPGRAMWRCRCACGATKDVRADHLTRGATQSCGCQNSENHRHRSERSVAHHPEYTVWRGMIERCCNPANISFRYYGARGIAVCDRWRNDFAAFLADVGARPSTRHSIDRINSNGHYEPGNCRWATWTEQNRNRRNNKLVTIDGVTKPLAAWSEGAVVKPATFNKRIRSGREPAAALRTPAQHHSA